MRPQKRKISKNLLKKEEKRNLGGHRLEDLPMKLKVRESGLGKKSWKSMDMTSWVIMTSLWSITANLMRKMIKKKSGLNFLVGMLESFLQIKAYERASKITKFVQDKELWLKLVLMVLLYTQFFTELVKFQNHGRKRKRNGRSANKRGERTKEKRLKKQIRRN